MPRWRSSSSLASRASARRRLGLVERACRRPARAPRPARQTAARAPRSSRAAPRPARPRARRRAPSRARLHRVTTRRTSPGAAPRSAGPQPRRTRRERRPGPEEPAERAVEVRAARGRAALDDDEPVRREDERRNLRAQLLGRTERRAVELGPLRLARPKRELDLEVSPAELSRSSIRAASAPKRTSCASLRVRGEKPCVPTCSASSRFVLPAPFSPTASTSPGSRASSREA